MATTVNTLSPHDMLRDLAVFQAKLGPNKTRLIIDKCEGNVRKSLTEQKHQSTRILSISSGCPIIPRLTTLIFEYSTLIFSHIIYLLWLSHYLSDTNTHIFEYSTLIFHFFNTNIILHIGCRWSVVNICAQRSASRG